MVTHVSHAASICGLVWRGPWGIAREREKQKNQKEVEEADIQELESSMGSCKIDKDVAKDSDKFYVFEEERARLNSIKVSTKTN
jgi:hypothetical protein